MKSSFLKPLLRKILFLVIVSALLAACGGDETPTPVDTIPVQMEEVPAESADDDQQEINTTGVTFEESELPEGFPESFPLHEQTKVGSTVDVPGDDSYRLFLAFPVPFDEVLDYYRQELPAQGWVIESETETSTGIKLVVASPEYSGVLDFVSDERGAVLDLTLGPSGSLMEIPEAGEMYGESEDLGQASGDFPADFPLPTDFTPIDLPPKLAGEGYQLAFGFANQPELALVELSTALMSGGWEPGEFQVDAAAGTYLVPFISPEGFRGYALVTGKPEVVGMDSVSGAVIALHTGDPP